MKKKLRGPGGTATRGIELLTLVQSALAGQIPVKRQDVLRLCE